MGKRLSHPSPKDISDSPEDTYDALKKYGTDLVERARQQKMDPVIGQRLFCRQLRFCSASGKCNQARCNQ